CLNGISGCSSAVKAGDRSASAACDPAKGCDTSTKAGKTSAQTSCGVGDCNTSATADTQGADTFCQARAGCSQNRKTPTPADQADRATAKTPGNSGGSTGGSSESQGTCTNNCALAGFATVAKAGSDCQSGNGACDTNSTGSRTGSTTPDTKPAP